MLLGSICIDFFGLFRPLMLGLGHSQSLPNGGALNFKKMFD